MLLQNNNSETIQLFINVIYYLVDEYINLNDRILMSENPLMKF